MVNVGGDGKSNATYAIDVDNPAAATFEEVASGVPDGEPELSASIVIQTFPTGEPDLLMRNSIRETGAVIDGIKLCACFTRSTAVCLNPAEPFSPVVHD